MLCCCKLSPIREKRLERFWSGCSKGWELCGEEAVSDNDTSRQNVWSEKDGVIPMRLLSDSYLQEVINFFAENSVTNSSKKECLWQEIYNNRRKKCCPCLDTFLSGSPLVQNGKLIGAVTHVFVDDPAKGYGICAETMVEQGGEWEGEKASDGDVWCLLI